MKLDDFIGDEDFDISDLARGGTGLVSEVELGFPWLKQHKKPSYVHAPIEWLLSACSLSGNAGMVALKLSFLSSVKRSARVSFNPTCLQNRISRFAVYRALRAMHEAGLIEWNGRKRGKRSLVTLNFKAGADREALKQ